MFWLIKKLQRIMANKTPTAKATKQVIDFVADPQFILVKLSRMDTSYCVQSVNSAEDFN